jgi:hypothetical protein
LVQGALPGVGARSTAEGWCKEHCPGSVKELRDLAPVSVADSALS